MILLKLKIQSEINKKSKSFLNFLAANNFSYKFFHFGESKNDKRVAWVKIFIKLMSCMK